MATATLPAILTETAVQHAVRLESARGYSCMPRMLQDLRTSVAPAISTCDPQGVAFFAAKVNQAQNDEDSEWLRELGVPEEFIPTLFWRFVDRGACWQKMVEELVDYQGDYSEL